MPRTTAPASSSSCAEGAPGEIYNIGGEDHENLEVTHRILELTGRRPVADPPRRGSRRATTAATRSTTRSSAALGWSPEHSFGETGLAGDGRLVPRRTATGGSRSSPATTAATTRSSTRRCGRDGRSRYETHAPLSLVIAAVLVPPRGRDRLGGAEAAPAGVRPRRAAAGGTGSG